MGKAQAAVELLVIISMMMLLLFIIFDFGENKLIESASILQVSQARNTVDRLAKAVAEVHNEGLGSRRVVYITIPDRVNPNRIVIGNTTITIGVYNINGTSDVSASTDFPVAQGGFFPSIPGSYWVWVISRQGYAQIGTSLSVTPSNIYLELFPTSSVSAGVTVANLANSTINITSNLTWSDSEVNTTINESSSLSFLLPPGTSIQPINLTVDAKSNASFGLHNGYLSIKTNITDNETIPVIINVVGQPAGLQNVSYLTVDTFNDSSYAYSNASFRQSGTVYYAVNSYNSTDSLVNSTITVRLYDANSNLASQQTCSPEKTGVYKCSYALAADAPVGSWKLTAYDIGGANAAMYITVSS